MTTAVHQTTLLKFKTPTHRAPGLTSLRRRVRTLRRGESIVVLANREPLRHERMPGGEIEVRRSSGGLVTALEPIIRACSGVWVAHGSGSADRATVDARDRVAVPPANPQYRLRRVWLTAAEERGYYYGFANEGLWPLCHRTPVAPVFRAADFSTYHAVNARFAAAVCEEIESARPLVLVQDYHFALAPRRIRERLPLGTIVAFWHIPWPTVAVLASCPWAARLVDGLLGSTIVGFQTSDDCGHFLDAAEMLLGASVDRERKTITHRGRATAVRVYPVSVEWPSPWAREAPPIDTCRALVRQQLGLPVDVRLAVGIDRLDFTKGIEEKFRAVEHLLASSPDLRGRFVFVQVAEPSRECLPAYRALRSRLRTAADHINGRFGTSAYQPLVLMEARHEPPDVFRLLRAADACYVGSLQDGMNLVAKEFVAARDDERGVLVLSQFAGAARELTDALIVNPYAADECAGALRLAVGMAPAEQQGRMRGMRAVVAKNNAYTWAVAMLSDAADLRFSADILPFHAGHDALVGVHA